jgi:release factor glutamine methyltransferase
VTLTEAAAGAARVLAAAGVPADDSLQDAALLARWVLGWSRTEWLTRQREASPDGFAASFQSAIARRAAREPVAYITGAREFYGRPFRITPDVLIPRPETEIVVDETLGILAGRPRGSSPRIADVGTGSGCLAVTLALEVPGAHVIAIDVSEPALRVAHDNAVALGAAECLEFWRGAYLPRGLPPFDLIVSNPPYVAEADRDSLPLEVRDFEPPRALYGGPDGLDVIRGLVHEAAATLNHGGWLVMEIGAGQSEAVAQIVADHRALAVTRIRPDLQAIPRVVVAKKR